MLLETTDLPVTDVAFAAGFASVRQFNDTVQEVFATTPTAPAGRAARRPAPAEPGTITLRLPYRAPMDLARTLDFLGARRRARRRVGTTAALHARRARRPGGAGAGVARRRPTAR